ncbi:MAG: thioredoxin [Dorea sp.]|jgi:hypothetical protein|nr:thioredoxin [Dorea sp.]MCI9614379.1 thioredoxin [Dorea sp.]MDE7036915.1 thioredoxin [Lachnospiraceae bacterium]
MSRILRTPRAGIILAVTGLVFMGIGIYRGEMAVVLEKAVNICMECVGIG